MASEQSFGNRISFWFSFKEKKIYSFSQICGRSLKKGSSLKKKITIELKKKQRGERKNEKGG